MHLIDLRLSFHLFSCAELIQIDLISCRSRFADYAKRWIVPKVYFLNVYSLCCAELQERILAVVATATGLVCSRSLIQAVITPSPSMPSTEWVEMQPMPTCVEIRTNAQWRLLFTFFMRMMCSEPFDTWSNEIVYPHYPISFRDSEITVKMFKSSSLHILYCQLLHSL